MGLRGLNYYDKHLYWELIKTWKVIRVYNIDKKIKHPLASQSDKI